MTYSEIKSADAEVGNFNVAVTRNRDECIKLPGTRCGQEVCDKNAVDCEQQDQDVWLNVWGIILATGFGLVGKVPLQRYGYSRIKSVITSMGYERLSFASVPTSGHLRDHQTINCQRDLALYSVLEPEMSDRADTI